MPGMSLHIQTVLRYVLVIIRYAHNIKPLDLFRLLGVKVLSHPAMREPTRAQPSNIQLHGIDITVVYIKKWCI